MKHIIEVKQKKEFQSRYKKYVCIQKKCIQIKNNYYDKGIDNTEVIYLELTQTYRFQTSTSGMKLFMIQSQTTSKEFFQHSEL